MTHSHARGVTCFHMWHNSFACVTWLVHMLSQSEASRFDTDVTHMNESCRRYEQVMPHVWTTSCHTSSTCMLEHQHVPTCMLRHQHASITVYAQPLMTHSYVWHDSLYARPSYMWHDSFICVIWLTVGSIYIRHSFIRDMTHSYVWRDSFIFVTWVTYIAYVWHNS